MTSEDVTQNGAKACMQCSKVLSEDTDFENTENGPLCRPCYDILAAEVAQIVAQQSEGVNFSNAVLGALAGAAAGSAAWWGFTVITNIEFGLFAVVIGFTVAQGILLATKGKRSRQLQILAAIVSTLAYVYANYLVNRTYVIRDYPEAAKDLTFWPDPMIVVNITRHSFDAFTVVFLAIVIYTAWRQLAPFQIKRVE